MKGRERKGERSGRSGPFSPIWSKKQVESVEIVVQICVGVLLRLGGESGWCFVLKSVGDRLCEKEDLDVRS